MAFTAYTTVSGDTWDIVAYKIYGQGKETMADRIMAANQHLLDYFIFPAGVTLLIPKIELDELEGMPPWMTEE